MTDSPGPGEAPDGADLRLFVETAVRRTTATLPTADAAAMRMVLALHRASGELVYDLESAVHRPRGWSWAGYRVLFVLWLDTPLESKRVARLTGMSRAAVSSLVNTLERDGLVDRRRAGHDRRSVELSLTTDGRAALDAAVAEHHDRERAWTAALSDAELAQLTGLLDKLMAGPAAAAANRRR